MNPTNNTDAARMQTVSETLEKKKTEQGAGQSLEAIVPRLGDVLVEKGYITDKQLAAALSEQQERQAAGAPIMLGNLLVEQGYLSRKELDGAIASQIFQLKARLETRNQDLEKAVARRTAELRVMVDRLSQLDQLKADFIANVSHELNTPLFHLQVSLDLLDDPLLGEIFSEKAEFVRSAKIASEKLQGLIDNMLSFSEATTSIRQALNLEVFPALRPVHTAVGSIQPIAAKKKIAIYETLPANLPEIKADEDRINWVMLQLIDNAVKFTHPGGQVGIYARQKENEVEMAVVDNGPGIPPERKEEIFEPFHQLHGGVSRPYEGLGLGLALARRIVEAHGAELRVRSRPEIGTAVSFTLPIAA